MLYSLQETTVCTACDNTCTLVVPVLLAGRARTTTATTTVAPTYSN